MLAAAPVRSILTLLPIQPGLSGGITMQGTLAEGAGAAFIAACARWSALAPFIPVAMGGIAGALLDSILGATMQHRRFCPTCARICVTEVHRCGKSTVPHAGCQLLSVYVPSIDKWTFPCYNCLIIELNGETLGVRR
jgi:hypothetical protein